jgi:hypothetical protein
MLEAFEWKYTPLEILEVDSRYPGLWEDIDTMRWQKELIKSQVGGGE